MAQKTMYPAINNSPVTTLAAAITVNSTTIEIADASALPAAPNIATIGEDDSAELVLYTGISNSSLTGCTRGFNSTTKKAWPIGSKIYRAFTAYDHDTFRENIADLASKQVELDPHNYAFDGKDLSAVFADADALYAAMVQEDYSKIRLGDYWPVTLNGTFRDYGSMTFQSGKKYYSDTALTTEVGTSDQDYAASPVGDNSIPGCHKPYCEVTIGGTKYYCDYDDCLPYAVKTLTNALMKFEVMPNVYYRYGDSGALSGNKKHILFSARDGLPTTLKMRKCNEQWEGQHIDTFTGDGTTAEFTLSGTAGTLGYVYVDGAKKTYNTDYTFGSNKITFKAGKIPAASAEIKIEWMDGTTPWNGSALYKTFNDPDYGIIKLIQTADAKLYSHILTNSGGGMRYYGEKRNKTGQQDGGWADRGVLFLPTEDEIWGRPIHSASGLPGYAQMQQWPIYQLGGRRHFAKGAGNGASRSGVWSASSAGVAYFALVGSFGIAYYSGATGAFVAAPCFIFCEA